MGCIITFQGKNFTEEEFVKYAYEEHLNLEGSHEIFHQLSSDENTFYDSQAESSTKEAKETLDKIKNLQQRIVFDELSHTYTLENGQKMESVSDFYQKQEGPAGEKGYYTFEGDPTKYENNRQWGNQLDTILRGVVLSKDSDEIKRDVQDTVRKGLKLGSGAMLSDAAIEQSIEYFNKFKEEHKDSIILSQVMFFNDEKNVAGTSDIVLIHPNGTISIIDLKSSLDFSKYAYQPANTARAFKQARHSAQLAAYKALAVSKGLEFDESNDLATYLIELGDIENDTIVNSVKDLGVQKIVGAKNIYDKLSKDAHAIGIEGNPIENSTHFGLYVDEIKKLIKNKIEKAKKENKPKQEHVFSELLKDLQNADNLKALSIFIDDTYRQFLGGEFYSLYISVQKDIIKIKKGDYDSARAIGILHDRQQIINLYLPIVAKLDAFYKQQFFTEQGKPIPIEVQSGSPLDKLKKVLLAAQDLDKLVKSELIPLQAEILSKMASNEANTVLESETQRRLDRYTKFKAETDAKKLDEKSQEYIRRKMREKYLKEQYDIIARNKSVNAGNIKNELELGSDRDISMWDVFLSPAISSENSVISNFAKLLKSKIEDVRQDLIDFSRKSVEKLEEYAKKTGLDRDNVEKFNEGLYEEINYSDDNKTLSFVQPLDMNKYYQNKGIEWARIENLNKTDAEKAELQAKWYDANTVMLEEDIKIGNTIVHPSISRIKEQMKKKLGENNYEGWERSNIFTSPTGEIDYSLELKLKYSVPNTSKYVNNKFNELKANEAKWSYYKFLVESYFKSQDLLPEYAQKGFILPAIRKHATTFEKAKSFYQELSNNDSQDVNIYGETEESSLKTVPILFTNKLDPSETSVDLISSVMLFEEAAKRYDMRSELAPLADTLLETVKSTSPGKTNSQGYQILDKAAISLGLDSLAIYMKKNNGNNIAALLEAFIDVQIYGKTKEKATTTLFGKEFDMGKVSDTLMSFQGFTQIGGNPLLSVANTLQANALATFEAIAGQYFNKTNWAEAKTEYAKSLPDFLSDVNSPINNSLIGQMVDLYDAMQGSYMNEYGREVSFSGKKKNLNYRAWYFMQHAGEHEIQVTAMIAKLKNTKVMQGNKEISMYDAYEIGTDGKIKLKAGVILKGNISKNGLMSKDIQFGLHAINKRLHGVYNDFDRPTIERFWYGRLLMMYRKFVVPGVKKRYKEVSVDQELGMITEGTYRTFFRLLINDFQEMTKVGFGFGNTKNSDLTEMEIMNVRRTTMELGTILMLGAMTFLLHAMMDAAGDDKKKKWALSYPLYWTMRLQTELWFYMNPADTLRMFKSPTAGYSTVHKALGVLNQLFSPTEQYQQRSGYADKGDYKLPYKTLKLFGINGYSVDPTDAISALNLSTL